MNTEKLFKLDLNLFNLNTRSTLEDGVKEYYDKNLLINAKPNLVHSQFGQKRKIPKRGGSKIEFRRFSKLSKATTPLTEGTPPTSTSLVINLLEATPLQFGAWVEVSDLLQTQALDDVLEESSNLLGMQAGETLDTIVRDPLHEGTNVMYGDGLSNIDYRHELVGGDSTPANNNYLTPQGVKNAARILRNKLASMFSTEGSKAYIAIIHPDLAFDLTESDDWIDASLYGKPEQIFNGEIGKLHGVRFVETTEAKIIHAPNLLGDTRNFVFASNSTATVTLKGQALTEAQADSLVGRYVIIEEEKFKIEDANAGAANSATIVLDGTPTASEDDIIYPGEAGAKGRDVYSVLFIGKDSYGVVDVEGMNLEMIYKGLGEGGSDPLNQKATNGWKAMQISKILNDNWILRAEVASSFGAN